MPRVSVVMGSDSDLKVMSEALTALESLDISYEVVISSAHRTPQETGELARSAPQRGIEVIIAGAGAAAHLAGSIAALTPLPVIGVPLSGSALGGVDALYSTVQMPRGIPVATVAVDGAHNAAVLAAQVIGVKDPEVRKKVEEYKEELGTKVKKRNEELQQVGYRQYLQKK